MASNVWPSHLSFPSSGITGVHPALSALVPFFPLHVPKRHPQHYRISLSPNQNGCVAASHVSSNPYIHVCNTRALLYGNVSHSKWPHNFLLKYWPHSSGFYLPGPTPWTLIPPAPHTHLYWGMFSRLFSGPSYPDLPAASCCDLLLYGEAKF